MLERDTANDQPVAKRTSCDWSLKLLPVVTVLLIGQTMFLNHVLGKLGSVHLTVYRGLPAVDRHLVNDGFRFLSSGSGVWEGFWRCRLHSSASSGDLVFGPAGRSSSLPYFGPLRSSRILFVLEGTPTECESLA